MLPSHWNLPDFFRFFGAVYMALWFADDEQSRSTTLVELGTKKFTLQAAGKEALIQDSGEQKSSPVMGFLLVNSRKKTLQKQTFMKKHDWGKPTKKKNER